MRKEIIAQKNPKSPISEIFRTLRTNIQFMNTNKRMKSLLVTSTSPGEGKSWTTANLAVTFAQAGKRVILIDADMRKGRQYAMFGVSPKPGLSNYLSTAEVTEGGNLTENVKDYIQKTDVENLYVITAGNVPPNPSELLVSAQMIKLLEKLQKLCDIVIIDGTPCELVTDSIILSRIVDSTIIVTAHKRTKKDALGRVINNIKNVGGNIAGVVLNMTPVAGKKLEEKYYYGNTTSSKSGKTGSKDKYESSSKSDRHQKIFEENLNRKEDTKQENTLENDNLNIVNNTENEGEMSDKTDEILKQINEYLETEKKKIK